MYRTGYQQPITRAPQDNDRYFIRNAKELQEAGIKFKKREGSGRLFDVVFLENGTIKTDFFFLMSSINHTFRMQWIYNKS
jgi:hypothetical protein